MLLPSFLLVSALLGLFHWLGSRWETEGVVYIGMCQWNICLVILCEMLWLNCSTCFWMYRKNASLDQWPIIMIRQTEQLLKNIAIAAPNLIECVPISSFLIFGTSSPIAWMVSFIAAISCLDVTWLILLNFQKADIGVSLSPFVRSDSADDGCSHPDWSHVDVTWRHLGDYVIFLVFLLHFKCDWCTVREF